MKNHPINKFIAFFHLIPALIFANFIFFLSQIPFLTLILRTSPKYFFPLSHIDWIHDYYAYLAVITQGKAGFWLNRPAFTTESISPGIYYIFYIFIGKFAAIFNLEPQIAYHLARVISVELFFAFLFLLSNLLTDKKKALLAFIFSLLATASPIVWIVKMTKPFPPPTIHWWTDLDAFTRLNSVPHHIFGQAMLLLSLSLLFYFFRSKKLSALFACLFIIFIGGIIFPAVITTIVIALPMAYFFQTIKNYLIKKKSGDFKTITLGLTAIIFFSLLSFIIIKLQENRGFPWNIWIRKEIDRWNFAEPYFDFCLILIFIALFFFCLPAIISIFKSGTFKDFFILFWALQPFLILPFANILHIPKIRLVQSAPFVPLGLLIADSYYLTLKRISACLYRKVFITIFLTLNLTTSIWLLFWKINLAKNNSWYDHMYLNQSVYSAIKFVQQSVPKNSKILTNMKMGQILPGFAPVVSYYGHQNQTMDLELKEKKVKEFYSGGNDTQESALFLKSNKISFVYFGEDEKKLTLNPPRYHFLKPVYNQDDILIYQVIDLEKLN